MVLNNTPFNLDIDRYIKKTSMLIIYHQQYNPIPKTAEILGKYRTKVFPLQPVYIIIVT